MTIESNVVQGANLSRKRLVIALPEPELTLDQDQEWCVVKVGDEWQQVRLHDYPKIYSIQGLYERLIYHILKCNSPATVRQLVERALETEGTSPAELRILDLGAGNGIVGAEMADAGAEFIIGVDIIPEAEESAERDRPGVYEHYHTCDLTDLPDEDRAAFEGYRFNCMTCIAALGFGDIPPEAFANAYNFVEDGGYVAFTIKEDFLDDNDPSGFAKLVRRMMDKRVISILKQKRYQHRVSTSGNPLNYFAIVGKKNSDIPAEWIG